MHWPESIAILSLGAPLIEEFRGCSSSYGIHTTFASKSCGATAAIAVSFLLKAPYAMRRSAKYDQHEGNSRV